MKLYRENIEVADLTIDRNSTITRRMMVEDSLRLNVSVAEPLDLRIQDYVVVEGERYELFDAPQLTIDGSTYGYDALFMGNMHRMERWLLEDGAGDDFTYFGTLDEHMSLILAAVCSKESGWSYTLNVDGVEAMPKSIAYGSVNCLSALHKVAQDYDFEFDVSQKQIVVAHRIERVSQFEFAVGRGEGLYKITRGKVSDAKITTRMYGLGAKTNMENEQRLALEEKYIERNVDKYGLREDKVVFEAIFPRHQGSLTSSAVQLEAGRVQWRVVDSKMDFDLKKQFMDEPKIVFTTGSCAGLEFVITDYDHATRSITFKEYADESQNPVYVVPNDNRKPLIGDEYHYINIIMPEVYVTNAKAELREAVEQELARVSVPTAPYMVDVDPRFIKAQGVRPANGDLVRITNDEVGLDALIRIIAVTYPVIDPNDVELTVCDNILISGSASMMREIRKEISGAMPNKHFHPLTGSKHLPLKASEVIAVGVETTLFRSEGANEFRGVTIETLPDGSTRSIFDEVEIRKSLKAKAFTIQEVEVEGGIRLEGAAKMQVSRVVDLTELEVTDPDYKANAYRLYFDSREGRLSNQFRVGDQVMCRRANATSDLLDIAYYWRVCQALGEDYIDLFKVNMNTFDMEDADCPGTILTVNREVDTGSCEPKELDVVCTCGNIYYLRRGAYTITDHLVEDGPRVEKWSYVTNFRPSKALNLTTEESANKIIQAADYITFRTRQGNKPVMLPPEPWSPGTVAHYPQQYVLGGRTYLCLDGNVTETPDKESENWLITADKGDRGENGKDAPVLVVQFSVDGVSGWHEVYQTSDRYRRESVNGGTTWSAAMRMLGEKGEAGADGIKAPYTDFSYGYGVTQPTVWHDAPPTRIDGQHLWERIQKYTPKENNSGWDLSSTSYAVINEYVVIGGVNLINNSTVNATGDVLNGFTFWKHLSTALVPGKSYIFSSSAPLIGVTKFAVTPVRGSGTAEQIITVNTPFTANAAHKSIYAIGPLAGNVGLRVQLESGNRATDWSPSPDDLQGEITAAADAAKAANTAVGNLNTYVDGAFKDGVIDEAEAKAIATYIKQINESELGVNNSYATVYNNPILTGVRKEDLAGAKTAVTAAITALKASVNAAIADGKTTADEKADVDAKFVTYNASYGVYVTALELATKFIQDVIKIQADKGVTEAAAAKAIADQAKADVTTQGDRLTQWASDSVVSPPEKMSLKDQHNAAIQEKISIDADAAKYGLTATTAYTQYVSGASAAFAAWNKYTQSIPENITIGADYSNIAAYYKFKSGILTAISDKVSKDYSDSIQIGGVNLILKSIVSTESPAGYAGFIGWWTLRQLLVPGKIYVFSTNIKSAEISTIAVAPVLGSGTGQQVIVPNVPFVANAAHKTIYMTGSNANNIGYVVQLEDGNKVTPWSRCQDDLKAEIDASINSFGFDSATELSAYLNSVPDKQNQPFVYDSTRGVLTLGTAMVTNLAANTLFTNSLTVNKLKTIPIGGVPQKGIIEINSGNSSSSGNIGMYNMSGDEKLNISPENMPTLESLLTGVVITPVSAYHTISTATTVSVDYATNEFYTAAITGSNIGKSYEFEYPPISYGINIAGDNYAVASVSVYLRRNGLSLRMLAEITKHGDTSVYSTIPGGRVAGLTAGQYSLRVIIYAARSIYVSSGISSISADIAGSLQLREVINNSIIRNNGRADIFSSNTYSYTSESRVSNMIGNNGYNITDSSYQMKIAGQTYNVSRDSSGYLKLN